mmetsp:Transcript_44757/g.149457  ORF Transcript_44757/g.149457 Transcript_44757/m.149457 type:complete len:225 (-) Transcript_44757:423-1097(-)
MCLAAARPAETPLHHLLLREIWGDPRCGEVCGRLCPTTTSSSARRRLLPPPPPPLRLLFLAVSPPHPQALWQSLSQRRDRSSARLSPARCAGEAEEEQGEERGAAQGEPAVGAASGGCRGARDKAVLLQPAGVVRCDRPKGGDLRNHGQRPAGQVLLAVERRRGPQCDQWADARKPAVGAPGVGERVAQPPQCVARLAVGQQADWDEGGALHQQSENIASVGAA